MQFDRKRNIFQALGIENFPLEAKRKASCVKLAWIDFKPSVQISEVVTELMMRALKSSLICMEKMIPSKQALRS